MKLPGLARMALAAFKAWRKDQAPRRGAALAYYALFAVGPVLVVAIAIAGAVFGEEAARDEIVGQIDNLIGAQGAQAVQSVLAAAGRNTRGATIGGLATLVVAATGAFLELQSALNAIWRVKTKPRTEQKVLATIWSFLWKRVKSLGLVVSLGFLLLVTLAVSAGLSALGGWLGRATSIAPALLDAFNILFSLAFITTLFALIYRILPDVELGWRDVWVGALITAGLFTLGKEAIRPLPRPQLHRVGLRRGGLARGAGAVGVLLLAAGAAGRGVHPRVHAEPAAGAAARAARGTGRPPLVVNAKDVVH